MTQYKIIESGSPNGLTREVNELIKEGWVPVGSHQVVIRKEQNRFRGQQHVDTLNDVEYSQTLIKEEPKEYLGPK
jgi:hypothetical protein